MYRASFATWHGTGHASRRSTIFQDPSSLFHSLNRALLLVENASGVVVASCPPNVAEFESLIQAKPNLEHLQSVLQP